MSVLLTLVTANPGISGVQRHALNLAACLLRRDDLGEVNLAIAPWQRDLISNHCGNTDRLSVHVVELKRNVMARNGWFYYGLPLLAKKINADVVHLSYPVPVQRRAFGAPLVVTLHDVYPFEAPENFGLAKAAFHRAIVRQCLSGCDAITCVSEATAQAMARFLPAYFTPKVSVIYNCVRAPSVTPLIPPELADAGPFLLSIAQHRHNKNIPLLLRIFKRLLIETLPPASSLVIVGMRGPETRRITSLIDSLGLTGRTILLEQISEDGLSWCYEHCEAVVVPSVTEGFCLPAAETLLAGGRLICADIPVLREIAGDRCVFVPLNSDGESGFSKAIAASLQRPRPKPALLPQFAPESIGAQYSALYRRLTAAMHRTGVHVSSVTPRPLTQKALLHDPD